MNRSDVFGDVHYRLMHVSKGLDCIIDKVCGPVVIWHRSPWCKYCWQLYHHVCVVDMSGDLVEVFFKSAYDFAVVTFYVCFKNTS